MDGTASLLYSVRKNGHCGLVGVLQLRTTHKMTDIGILIRIVLVVSVLCALHIAHPDILSASLVKRSMEQLSRVLQQYAGRIEPASSCRRSGHLSGFQIMSVPGR